MPEMKTKVLRFTALVAPLAAFAVAFAGKGWP